METRQILTAILILFLSRIPILIQLPRSGAAADVPPGFEYSHWGNIPSKICGLTRSSVPQVELHSCASILVHLPGSGAAGDVPPGFKHPPWGNIPPGHLLHWES